MAPETMAAREVARSPGTSSDPSLGVWDSRMFGSFNLCWKSLVFFQSSDKNHQVETLERFPDDDDERHCHDDELLLDFTWHQESLNTCRPSLI